MMIDLHNALAGLSISLLATQGVSLTPCRLPNLYSPCNILQLRCALPLPLACHQPELLALEEHADRLSVVQPANALGEKGRNVDHLQLGALRAVLVLSDRVGDDDAIER
jgi:hypothetical protein